MASACGASDIEGPRDDRPKTGAITGLEERLSDERGSVWGTSSSVEVEEGLGVVDRDRIFLSGSRSRIAGGCRIRKTNVEHTKIWE
jgi:hypothetical protein